MKFNFFLFTQLPEILFFLVSSFFVFYYTLNINFYLKDIIKNFLFLLIFLFIFKFSLFIYYFHYFSFSYFHYFSFSYFHYFSFSYIITPYSMGLKTLIYFLGIFLYLIKYNQVNSIQYSIFSYNTNINNSINYVFSNRKARLQDVLYFFIINLALFSITIVVCSNDFLLIYICMELFSLSSSILISSYSDNPYFVSKITVSKNLLCSLYYFIASTTGSCFFLLGSVLLYGTLGTLNLSELILICSSFSFHYIYSVDFLNYFFSILLILLGIFIKGGLAPFHYWIFSVYSIVSYFILTFLLIFSKFLLILICYKFYYVFIDLRFFLYFIFNFIGFINIFIGSLLAIQQYNLKRFLISSSLTNSGYMFILMIGFNNFENSFISFILFSLIYFISMLGIMFILCSQNNINFFKRVREINNFSHLIIFPFYIKMFIVFLIFSLMGIPLFIGFWFKTLILLPIVNYKNYFIFIFLMFLSSLSMGYYLSLSKYLLFDFYTFLNNNQPNLSLKVLFFELFYSFFFKFNNKKKKIQIFFFLSLISFILFGSIFYFFYLL